MTDGSHPAAGTEEPRARVIGPDGPRHIPPAAPPRARSRWSTGFNLVMFVIGAIALAFMLRTTSWEEVWAVVDGIAGWAALILALDLLALCLDAAAWHAFMRPEARMVPYWRVLGAFASGRAINALTPGGSIGEATKITLLLDHAPRARIVSSLVLLNIAMLYLAVVLMAIGIPVTLLLVDVPPAMKVMIAIGVAVIVPVMIAIGLLIHRGASRTVIDLIRRTRVISADRAATWKAKLRDVDKHLRELHTNRTSATRAGFGWLVLGKTASVISTIVVIAAIGVDLNAALVLAVLSVGVLLKWVSTIVPLGLGIYDGGNYALYDLLGASGLHGMVVAMLNRARSVAVAMLGLVAMAALTAFGRRSQSRIRERIAELRDRRS